ncbi:hypothetical protein GPECTOR_40g528 [Gonium pectorale]|uniref:Methyltransferase small domain-containing protein n=1 Tax=Gonium pectorale TaxID=33097 RepID=A0A150GAD3_GONPE|nr:hypothetical protein GPECTOR_40g528 [Gonium pectorale]|eukprot:KXZ46794.1 hypothetical protein GPECTOR_40g528 [Gonium pectorale]
MRIYRPEASAKPNGAAAAAGSSSSRAVAASAATAGAAGASAADAAVIAADAEAAPAPAPAANASLLEAVRPRSYTAAEVFQCHEESLFYSQALEKLLPIVAQRQARRAGGGGGGAIGPSAGSAPSALPPASGGGGAQPPRQLPVIEAAEFGSGDGTPVVNALMKTHFDGMIHGFELNPTSAALARAHVAAYGLSDKYQIHNGCFYKGTSAPDSPASGAACLVSNPPYLPAPDSDILMPELHGGVDGAGLTRDLLSLGFPYAMLLVSSYSNPASVLRHAAAQGYRVVDYLVTPLPFGTYSSQPKVRNWISGMRSRGEAFYNGNTYLLAGVLFEKLDLPPCASPSAAATPASQIGQNGNGHNGNGHNGNSHNGNGHSGGEAVTVYHNVAETADGDSVGESLLRLLTAL